MKIVRNEIAELSFNKKESVLHIKMLEGANLNLTTIKQHALQIEELTSNKPYLALVDIEHLIVVDDDALKFAGANSGLHKRVAAAYYNPSLANRFTIEVFRKKNKPAFPVEVFKAKQEAEQWLKTQTHLLSPSFVK